MKYLVEDIKLKKFIKLLLTQKMVHLILFVFMVILVVVKLHLLPK